MKTIVNRLLQGRGLRWSLLAAVLAVGGLCAASMDNGQHQLGGSFIGSSPASVWNVLQIPLDPAGRTAAIRVASVTWDAGTAGLMVSLDADTQTDAVGQARMISRDTATWSFVWYAQKADNPPQIKGIFVADGTLKFTGPDDFVINYTFRAYLPTADANGDGLPDAGAVAIVTIPDLTATAKRVPLP